MDLWGLNKGWGGWSSRDCRGRWERLRIGGFN